MGGVVVGLVAGVAAGLAATAFVVGCTTRSQHHRVAIAAPSRSYRSADPAELRWLQRLGKFVAPLRSRLARAEKIETQREMYNGYLPRGAKAASLIRAMKALATCRMDLASVGAAPSQRLRKSSAFLRQACAHLAAYGRELTKAVRAGDISLVPLAQIDDRMAENLLFLLNPLVARVMNRHFETPHEFRHPTL